MIDNPELGNALVFVDHCTTESLCAAVNDKLSRIEGNITVRVLGEGEVREEVVAQLSEWGRIQWVENHEDVQMAVFCCDDVKWLSDTLHQYADASGIHIIAPMTPLFWKKRPLYLIGIPKSGTHLLMALAQVFGYVARGVSPEKPKGGEWYYIEHSNAHTVPKMFFSDSVYRGEFGLRDHPFIYSPALFIFRNPADVLVSEANYYHKRGNSAYYHYFHGQSFSQRLSCLIQDPNLLGSIRERIIQYVAWLSFPNIIPVSFEEFAGSRRGGDDHLLHKLIWSLQLKLQVPGRPDEYASRVLGQGSDTLYKGLCGVYKECFSQAHYEAFDQLDDDYLQAFGYKVSTQASVYSSRISARRRQPLIVDSMPDWPPIIRDNQFLDHRIIEYGGALYGVPFGTRLDDIKQLLQKEDSAIVSGRYIDEVRVKLIKRYRN